MWWGVDGPVAKVHKLGVMILAAFFCLGLGQSWAGTGIRPAGGLAQRQLNHAVLLTPSLKTGADEASASYASEAFDNNRGAGRQADGLGAASSVIGNGGANPNGTAGSGATGSAVEQSEAASDDCSALAVKFGWQGSFENSPAGGCVKSESGHSVDPTDRLFQLLTYLDLIATIIAVTLFVLGWLQYSPYWEAVKPVFSALATALIVIGSIMFGLDCVLMGMGRPIEGGIFAALGLFTIYGGCVALQTAREGGSLALTGEIAVTKIVEALATTAMTKCMKQAALQWG